MFPRIVTLITISLASVLGVLGAQQQLQQVTNFGSNPTNVKMYTYRPSGLATKPALIVAMHYCTGTAQAYFSGTQYANLADSLKSFMIIYPSAPDSGGCWDVHTTATLTHNGGGDSLGIVSMVKYAISTYGVDASRVFATGTSSGAMMTNVLLGAYPDVFKAGAAFAGVPFACFAGSGMWNNDCANGVTTKTPQQWGDLVRNAYPGFSGDRPAMQIWQGTNDQTLNYHNFGEGIKQWTNVFGYSQTPTSTQSNSPLSGWTRQTFGPKFQAISAQGVSHDIPVQANDVLNWFGITGNTNPTTSNPGPTTTFTTTTTSSVPTPVPTGGGQAHWAQCGGQGWAGGTTCVSPYTCTVINAFYSQERHFKKPSLDTLPLDLLVEIMLTIGWKDILQLRQVCLALNHATRIRHIWLHQFHLRSRRPPPRGIFLEKPLKDYSTSELEAVVLKKEKATVGWTRGKADAHAIAVERGDVILDILPGGGWCLARSERLEVVCYDLDQLGGEGPEQTPSAGGVAIGSTRSVLVPNFFRALDDSDPCPSGGEDMTGRLFTAYDVDREALSLTFKLAVRFERFVTPTGPQVPEPRRVTQVWCCEPKVDGSRVIGFTPTLRSTFYEDDIIRGAVGRLHLSGQYLVTQFVSDVYSPTTVMIIEWQSIDGQHKNFPRRYVCRYESRVQYNVLPRQHRLLLAGFDDWLLIDLRLIPETTTQPMPDMITPESAIIWRETHRGAFNLQRGVGAFHVGKVDHGHRFLYWGRRSIRRVLIPDVIGGEGAPSDERPSVVRICRHELDSHGDWDAYVFGRRELLEIVKIDEGTVIRRRVVPVSRREGFVQDEVVVPFAEMERDTPFVYDHVSQRVVACVDRRRWIVFDFSCP